MELFAGIYLNSINISMYNEQSILYHY